MSFPVIQSVLDPKALAEQIRQRYGFQKSECRLVNRGMNDIYSVSDGEDTYAFKIGRANSCSDPDLEWEIGYVSALNQAGFAVATPRLCTDGSSFLTFDAPEGLRQGVMMDWLEGEEFSRSLSPVDSREIGALLAQMHLATMDYKPQHIKKIEAERKIMRRLPMLLNLFPQDAPQRVLLEEASCAVAERFSELDRTEIAWGPCHGDLQYGNVMRRTGGELAVFDFADCGEDFLARDLAAFYWRNEFDGLTPDINAEFLAGYQSVRPMSQVELELTDLFNAMRHLVIFGALAEFSDRIGRVPGFDKNLDHYVAMIRFHCEKAGLATNI